MHIGENFGFWVAFVVLLCAFRYRTGIKYSWNFDYLNHEWLFNPKYKRTGIAFFLIQLIFALGITLNNHFAGYNWFPVVAEQSLWGFCLVIIWVLSWSVAPLVLRQKLRPIKRKILQIISSVAALFGLLSVFSWLVDANSFAEFSAYIFFFSTVLAFIVVVGFIAMPRPWESEF